MKQEKIAKILVCIRLSFFYIRQVVLLEAGHLSAAVKSLTIYASSLCESRCRGKFVAPEKFFPPPYCHNATNANPNPYCCVWE